MLPPGSSRSDRTPAMTFTMTMTLTMRALLTALLLTLSAGRLQAQHIRDHRDFANGRSGPQSKNRCVNNVTSQVRTLAAVKGKIVRHAKPRATPALRWWQMLNDQRFNVCHLQGLVRLTGASADGVFAFVNNTWGRKKGFKCGGDAELNSGGPVLFVSDHERPPRYRTIVFWLKNFGSGAHPFGEKYNWHPGGMQALGSYLFVGTDDGGDKGGNDSVVWIIDASDPGHPHRVNQFYNEHSRAEALAAARLPDDRIIVAVGSREGEHMEVFVSETTNIATTEFHQVRATWPGKYPGEEDSNFNNYAFIQQCDSRFGEEKLYLAGLTNNDYRYGGGVPFDDNSHLHLYELRRTGSRGGERFLFSRTLPNRLKMHNPHGSRFDPDVSPNWSAGGTIWVNTHGCLEAYATEHVPQGGDLDVLTWKAPASAIRDHRTIRDHRKQGDDGDSDPRIRDHRDNGE